MNDSSDNPTTESTDVTEAVAGIDSALASEKTALDSGQGGVFAPAIESDLNTSFHAG